ncbi:MAG: VCBS repeat-containing protein [Bacteroidetes bacterium]|nr:VCBS repeat-containing protein [Bacteroidota bacterium]
MKKILLSAALLMTCLLQSQVQNPCFSSPTNYVTGGYPRGICATDFNNDGHPDIAVVNSALNSISVLLGSATGTLSAAANYGVGTNPQGICTADFNSDGHPDLAVTNTTGTVTGVSVLLGSATGTISSSANYAIGTSPIEICSADFNGDGHPDVAVTNQGAANLSIFLGSATGALSAATNYSLALAPYSVESTDFNNDGHLDIVTSNYNNSSISVLLGSATGTLSAATNYSVGASPSFVCTADFNGDGHPDVASSNGGSNTVSVLLGSATGTLSPAMNYNIGIGPQRICSADFNNDGHLDVALTASNTVSFLLGSATGALSPSTNYTIGNGPYGICSADFNGDGYIDVAVGRNNITQTAVFLSSPSPSVAVSVMPVTPLCAGSTATLVAIGATTYTWSTGATASNTTASPSVTTTYSVTGTNTVGCTNTATTSIVVNAYDVIHGQVDTSGTLITHSAWVYLYQHLSSNIHLAAVDSMQIQANGAYSFSVATPGNYFIGVVPDTTVYHRAATTYYNSTHPVYLWDSAQFVSIGGCNNNTTYIAISLIQTPAVNPLATGIISGNVQSDGTYIGHRMAQGGNNSVMGVPLRGIGVSLGKVPGGGCAARTATDASGNYAFSHVEVGNYIVYVDLPNYKRDSSYHVSISATSSVSANNNYLVDSTSIYTTHATGIKQFASGSHNVWIYPNPAGSQLHIQNSAALGSISVYNALGQMVEAIQSKENTTTLDVSSYAPGLYTVLLSSGYSTFVKE